MGFPPWESPQDRRRCTFRFLGNTWQNTCFYHPRGNASTASSPPHKCFKVYTWYKQANWWKGERRRFLQTVSYSARASFGRSRGLRLAGPCPRRPADVTAGHSGFSWRTRHSLFTRLRAAGTPSSWSGTSFFHPLLETRIRTGDLNHVCSL